jgi:asparagine synthase (glutamine-hydrolysing)
MAGLVPKSILWRKDKLGFEAPRAAWIKAARTSMVPAIRGSAILDSMCKEEPNFDRIDDASLWKLYNIAKWEEIYSVQPAAPEEVRSAESVREAVPVARPF